MNLEELWTDLIRQLKSYPNVNASQIDAFFSRVQVQAASQGFVMFTSDNSFIKDWIEKHYIKDIQQALKDLYGAEFVVQIEVDPTSTPVAPLPEAPQTQHIQQGQLQSPTTQDYSQSTPFQNTINTAYTQKRGITEPLHIKENHVATSLSNYSTPLQSTPDRYENQVLNEGSSDQRRLENQEASLSNTLKSSDQKGFNSLTFENFVIGDSNQMAYSMAVEVADHPGSSALNPLFIYGRSGVGKTHLLCAIKNYINEQYRDFNVIYIDSMELVNRYSDAAIEKNVDKQSFKNFDDYFQQADVLLIDDIQGLQGKPGTLSALFRIFNKMITKGKQFVFSADRAPKNIDLDERYVSRFNSGATIDIQPPDDETKRSIIKSFISQYKKEEDLPFIISDSILDYIIDNSSSNIRELKSAITNVIFALKWIKVTNYLNSV